MTSKRQMQNSQSDVIKIYIKGKAFQNENTPVKFHGK